MKTNQDQNYGSSTAGFSLFEVLAVVAIIGILSALAFPTISNVNKSSRQAKLSNDIHTLNSAVITYLGTGGNLDGLDDAQDVITRLKQSLTAEDRQAHIGFAGATLDTRMALRMVSEVKYTPARVANWNSSKLRFEMTEFSGSTPSSIAEFYLDEEAIPEKLYSDNRSSAIEFNREDGWVWQYEDAIANNYLQPTTINTIVPSEPVYVPTGPEIDVDETFVVNATTGANSATNPGFEAFIDKSKNTRLFGRRNAPNAYYIDQSEVFGWNTTASNGLIEIWESGFNGVEAYNGGQFVEFNATEVSTLYQLVDTNGASSVRIFFAHGQRSRATEQLRLYVGRNEPLRKTRVNQAEDLEAQGFEIVLETDSRQVGGWTTYSHEYAFEDAPDQLYFAFQSVGEFSTRSIGNFLDDVSFQAVAGKEVTGLQVDLTQGTSISNVIESGEVVLTGARPGDSLDIDGSLPSSLTYSVFSDASKNEITLSIDGRASRWTYEAAFSKVKFNTSSSDNTSRVLQFSANDGIAVSQPVSFEITL